MSRQSWHTHPIYIHRMKRKKGRYRMADTERDKLMKAMFSLQKSIEHQTLMHDDFDGVADAMVNNYRTLHNKIAEHYEDDYYITDVLKLDVPEGATDKQKVSLVQLAASQMSTYLKSLARGERRERFRRGEGPPPPHWKNREERDFGRELSDEIMNFTKETLRRALDSLDIVVEGEPPEPPPPPKPPKRKPKPDVDIDEDDVI